MAHHAEPMSPAPPHDTEVHKAAEFALPLSSGISPLFPWYLTELDKNPKHTFFSHSLLTCGVDSWYLTSLQPRALDR